MRVSLRQLATVAPLPTASRPAPGFDRVLGLIDLCEPPDRRTVQRGQLAYNRRNIFDRRHPVGPGAVPSSGLSVNDRVDSIRFDTELVDSHVHISAAKAIDEGVNPPRRGGAKPSAKVSAVTRPGPRPSMPANRRSLVPRYPVPSPPTDAQAGW
jgi:hypothetical protein